MGFGVCSLGFGVWGLGLRVCKPNPKPRTFRVLGFVGLAGEQGFRGSDSAKFGFLKVRDLPFRGLDSRFTA